MKCPNASCGVDNPEGARFCLSCGAALPASVPDTAERECPCCGNMVPGQARFCNKCGMRLDIEPPPGSDSPSPTLEPLAGDEPEPIADTGSGESPFDQPTIMDPGPLIQSSPAEIPVSTRRSLPFVIAGVSGAAVAVVVLWMVMAPSGMPPAETPPPPAPAAVMPPPLPATVVETPASAATVAPAETPAPSATVLPLEPSAAPAPAAQPGAATIVDTGPASASPPVARPFRNLVEPRAAETPPPPTAEELRWRAERARRAEERKAKELAAQQAREAAEREAALLAAQPRSPEEICAGESGFTRNSCESRVCQQSQWMYHPFCMKRREAEEHKRRGGL